MHGLGVVVTLPSQGTTGLGRGFRHTAHLIHRRQVEGARGDQRVAFTAHEDAVDVEEATVGQRHVLYHRRPPLPGDALLRGFALSHSG